MPTHEGTVNALNWTHWSKTGNEWVMLQVDGQKYYCYPKNVDSTIQIGDVVTVEYELGDDGKYRRVSKATVKTPAPPGQGKPGSRGKPVGDTQITNHILPTGGREDVIVRSTALKCASELIACKIIATVTGSEGICSLAEEFVGYLKTGELPKTVKQATK